MIRFPIFYKTLADLMFYALSYLQKYHESRILTDNSLTHSHSLGVPVKSIVCHSRTFEDNLGINAKFHKIFDGELLFGFRL